MLGGSRRCGLRAWKWLGVGECAEGVEKQRNAKDFAPGNGQMREYKKEQMLGEPALREK